LPFSQNSTRKDKTQYQYFQPWLGSRSICEDMSFLHVGSAGAERAKKRMVMKYLD